jgi:signal transduction histidine kinase
VLPLAGSALIFWTVYLLQQDSIRRVRELEQTRTQLVDDSAARLRRIERDLHDGAQAQMVAVAMKLGLATKKLSGMVDGTGPTDLDRVLELVAAAARYPSSSSWTCPSGRRPRSRPSPTSARPRCWLT